MDMQRHRVDQVDVVAFPGQRQRVHARSSANVEYRGGGRWQVSSEQLSRSKVFEVASSSAKQAFSLYSLLVVGQYFGIQLFLITDGSRLLSRLPRDKSRDTRH